jgi:outer membrane protein assembly factor BamB
MRATAALVPRWTKTLRDYAHHSLTVSDDRIILREGHDRLLCLMPSGRVAWQREMRGGHDVWGTLHHIAGSVYADEQPVLRIDAQTGRIMASRDLGPWPYLGVSSGSLTCGSDTEGAYSILDPESLDPIWTFRDVAGNCGLHDGLLCIAEADGRLRLVDPDTTDVVGRAPAPFGAAGHVHFRDSVCVFGDRERMAFDFGLDTPTWRHDETPSTRSAVIGPGSSVTIASIGYHDSPRARGGVAYCQGRALSAYDLSTGDRLWRQLETHGTARISDPREGRMAVVTRDSRVHIIDLGSGDVLATSEPLDREIHAVEVLSGGCVVVESFTHNRNASQIHFLEPAVQAQEAAGR